MDKERSRVHGRIKYCRSTLQALRRHPQEFVSYVLHAFHGFSPPCQVNVNDCPSILDYSEYDSVLHALEKNSSFLTETPTYVLFENVSILEL